MAYIEGFVAAVPRGNKDAYQKHAAGAVSMFKEFGATRQLEAWGDDVPDGKVTDFKGAVKATGDEKIVYSWIEMAVEAGARRGLAEDHAGRTDEARPRQHAVRRQAHDLRRLHADRRRVSKPAVHA